MKNKFENNKFNVCLFGASLDTGNRGVMALLASTVKICLEIFPSINLYLFIGNKSNKSQELYVSGRWIQLNVINYRLSPKSGFHRNLFFIFLLSILQWIFPFSFIKKGIIQSNEWLKILNQADFIGDIHGGDSFSDIYGLNTFIVSSLSRLTIILLKKHYVLLPQTYGPYYSYIARWIARIIMMKADYILARDKQGLKIVNDLLGKNVSKKIIKFCPDVAFYMDAVMPKKVNIQPSLSRSLKVPLVGLNINGLLYNGGYTRDNMFNLKCDYKLLINQIIEKFLSQTDVHILLIPHTFGKAGNINSDPDASKIIFDNLFNGSKKRLHILKGEYDQYEIKGIIKNCDFFIGSRMHACIAALSQEIPTIGIAYSRKFIGVFDSVGVGNMIIDARSVNNDTAINKIFTNYGIREKAKVVIRTNVQSVKGEIYKIFKEILKNAVS